jgi:hypothetical protein
MNIYFFLMAMLITTYIYWLGSAHLVGWKKEILIKE